MAGLAGLTSAWAMARRRPSEYRRENARENGLEKPRSHISVVSFLSAECKTLADQNDRFVNVRNRQKKSSCILPNRTGVESKLRLVMM